MMRLWAIRGRMTLAGAVKSQAEFREFLARYLPFYRVIHWQQGAESGTIHA